MICQLIGYVFQLSRITKKVGCIIEVDMFSLENGYAKVVRIRIDFLLSKSLLHGVWIPLSMRDPVWIEVKYERLPRFCYNCGRLTHEMRNCTFWMNGNAGLGNGCAWTWQCDCLMLSRVLVVEEPYMRCIFLMVPRLSFG